MHLLYLPLTYFCQHSSMPPHHAACMEKTTPTCNHAQKRIHNHMQTCMVVSIILCYLCLTNILQLQNNQTQYIICIFSFSYHPINHMYYHTSRKRGFRPAPLVAKLQEPRLMKSLVAVRQMNRDQMPGPRALAGFSRGWPGQPRIKLLPYIYQFSTLTQPFGATSLHKLHKGVQVCFWFLLCTQGV